MDACEQIASQVFQDAGYWTNPPGGYPENYPEKSKTTALKLPRKPIAPQYPKSTSRLMRVSGGVFFVFVSHNISVNLNL